MNIKNYRFYQMSQRIKTKGGHLLLVGGMVRDHRMEIELGLKPSDWPFERENDCDAVVFGLGLEETKNSFAALGPSWIIEHRTIVNRMIKEPALVKVKVDDVELSVAIAKKNMDGSFFFYPEAQLNDDAQTRDFTVNAIYYDPLEKAFFDPLGGLDDLLARRLKICSETCFTEDPVRILRAMVFISRFGLTPSPQLTAAANQAWPLLVRVPSERFWPEWRKWTLSRSPHFGLNFLKESGALNFWPDLAALCQSPQRLKYHPEGDVWNHTVLAVEVISRLEIANPSERSFMILTCLLHDIGKPIVTK
ncbi:MAG: hypothetical protein LBV23_06915, partial [Deltaproteobacteria bacterium]|nr:hypothetical protein [Deltaproteobacteria bacterium]